MESGTQGRILEKLVGLFRRIRHSTVIRQTGLLYSSRILVLLTSFITAIIVPRVLGPGLYGDLTFITSFLFASQGFFDLGVFESSAKMMAGEKDPTRQSRLLGGYFVIFAVIILAYSLFIYSAGSWIDSVFDSSVGVYFPLIVVFSSGNLVRDLVMQLSKGLNRVRDIVLMIALPALGYVTLVLVLNWVNDISIPHLLNGKFGLIWLVVALCAARMRPDFSRLSGSLKEIAQDVRRFGFKVFTGRALNTAVLQSDKLFIGLLGSTTSVGFYYLARVMVTPIEFFPAALSTSFFRRLGTSKKIPGKVLIAIFSWMILSSGVLLLAGKPVLEFIFPVDYASIVPMMFIAMIGAVLGGLVHPYHEFLIVKGYGVELRRISLVLTFYILGANWVLISLYGAMGAVYAYIGEKAISITLHDWYYRQAVRAANQLQD